MIVFPNCKINLGLQVVNKRPDGYHTIETVFYPIAWCDILEIIENKADSTPFLMSSSGIEIAGDMEDNLIYKAWQMISSMKKTVPVKVHLHKNIPMGAGLGGGSSDAAHFINLMNDKFSLSFTRDEMAGMASRLGSDCAFFINNKVIFAHGRGNEFSEIAMDLSNYYLLLIYPGIHSNTKSAYEGVKPKKPSENLPELFKKYDIADWKNKIVNDFEPSIFKKFPEIQSLKEKLYDSGALYASLSGSGSSVFGIFDKEPQIGIPSTYQYFLQKPSLKIL